MNYLVFYASADNQMNDEFSSKSIALDHLSWTDPVIVCLLTSTFIAIVIFNEYLST